MDRSEPDLNALEARLAGWQPSTPRLDRDRMLFLAGRASARSETRGRLAIVSVVCLSLMAGLLVRERSLTQALKVAVKESSRPPSVLPAVVPQVAFSIPGSESYLVLTQRALASEMTDEVAARLPERPSSTPSISTQPLRVRDRAQLEGL